MDIFFRDAFAAAITEKDFDMAEYIATGFAAFSLLNHALASIAPNL